MNRLGAWINYRSITERVALGVLCAVVVAAVSAGVVVVGRWEAPARTQTLTGPGGERVPLAPARTAAHQMLAVVLHTYSDQGQADLLDRRLNGLVQVAAADGAQLSVYLGDDAPEVHQRLLASQDLARVGNQTAPLPTAAAQALLDQVHAALGQVPPAPATSVPGALRLLASLAAAARRSKASEVVGWLVGDSISTVRGCDFYVADMSPAATDATARACLGAAPIELGGSEVRLVGVGQDLSGGTDPIISQGTVAVVSRMVELAHGRPTIAFLDGGPRGIRGGR